MARSGSVTAGSGVAFLELSWETKSQSVEDNSSVVAWQLSYVNNSSSYYISMKSLKAEINGEKVFDRTWIAPPYGQFPPGTIASGEISVEHDDDGTKDISVGILGEGGIYSLQTYDASQNFTLETIPRATAISHAADTEIGSKCAVRWTPASASQRFRLKFSLGTWSYTTGFIYPKRTGTYTYNGYTIPLSAANQIPDSRTGSMSVELFTYSSSGTQIGDSDVALFTVSVPQSMAPEVCMSLSPVNGAMPLADISSLYIQGKSAVRADFEGTAAQYGASIVSCVLSVGTAQYSAAELIAVSDVVSYSGTVSVKGTVTDSRGISVSVSENIDVIAYSVPSVIPYSGSRVVCERTPENDLLIEAGRQYSRITVDGVQQNFCTLSYRYAVTGTSLPEEWTVILAPDSSEDRVSYSGGVTLDEKTSYTVELKAEDELGGIKIISFAVSTRGAAFHLRAGGRGAAFGKYAEEDYLLDVAWDAHFRGLLNGMCFRVLNLSTESFDLSMAGSAQNVFLFGKDVLGVIEYDGTSTEWNGSDGTSCSTADGIVSVTVPTGGNLVAISDNIFEKK